MSLIHEALRRGSSSQGGARAAHADSVLRTLGYRRRPARRRSLAVLLIALLGTVSYAAWTWTAGPEDVRARPVAASRSRLRTPPSPSAPLKPRPPAEDITTPPPRRTFASTATPARQPVSREPDHEKPTRAAAKRPAPAPPPAVATRTADTPSLDDFRLALYFQRAGDLGRAQSHYRAALTRNPINAEAHNNLALLLKEAGRIDEALAEFQRALAINPRYVRALNNRAVTELAQGRLDAAAADLDAALAIDPQSVDALINLALARKAAGQLEEARSLLARALTIDPRSAAAHYNLAVQFDSAGEPTRAVEHYRAFLEFAGADYADRTTSVRARLARLERGES